MCTSLPATDLLAYFRHQSDGPPPTHARTYDRLFCYNLGRRGRAMRKRYHFEHPEPYLAVQRATDTVSATCFDGTFLSLARSRSVTPSSSVTFTVYRVRRKTPGFRNKYIGQFTAPIATFLNEGALVPSSAWRMSRPDRTFARHLSALSGYEALQGDARDGTDQR